MLILLHADTLITDAYNGLLTTVYKRNINGLKISPNKGAPHALVCINWLSVSKKGRHLPADKD